RRPPWGAAAPGRLPATRPAIRPGPGRAPRGSSQSTPHAVRPGGGPLPQLRAYRMWITQAEFLSPLVVKDLRPLRGRAGRRRAAAVAGRAGVGPSGREEDLMGDESRVIVGYDGTGPATLALDRAAREATERGDRLVVAYAAGYDRLAPVAFGASGWV